MSDKKLTLLNFDKKEEELMPKVTVDYIDGSQDVFFADVIGESTDISGFLVFVNSTTDNLDQLINKAHIRKINIEVVEHEIEKENNEGC
jgi:hypothetical protein